MCTLVNIRQWPSYTIKSDSISLSLSLYHIIVHIITSSSSWNSHKFHLLVWPLSKLPSVLLLLLATGARGGGLLRAALAVPPMRPPERAAWASWSTHVRRWTHYLGDKLIPPLNRESWEWKSLLLGWWPSPILYGNNGSLDASTNESREF